MDKAVTAGTLDGVLSELIRGIQFGEHAAMMATAEAAQATDSSSPDASPPRVSASRTRSAGIGRANR
jgi:hypothetical protein